jgi:hypothetical protein
MARTVKQFSYPQGVALLAVAGLIFAAGQAQAQTCPSDLSSLSGQILTPSLQGAASKTIDQIIQSAGDLSQAIAKTQQELSDTQAAQAHLGPDTPSLKAQTLSDLVLILQTTLQALQCRQGS